MKMRYCFNILQGCIKRPAGWMISCGCCFLTGISIYLLVSQVTVIQAADDAGSILKVQQVNGDSTMIFRYIHSVARCPMLEKYEITDEHEILLKESWNCSFGAGIEAQTPEGSTIRKEDGYFIYEGLDQTFAELSIHAVELNNYTIQIDEQTWKLSQAPFLGQTISFSIKKQNRFLYLWRKVTVWLRRGGVF